VKVIDSDDYRSSGIETLFFPGGEPHARIPENFGDALLFLKPRTWNDIGTAIAVLGALSEQRHLKSRKIWLFCPYFPGARQDRSDGCTPITKRIIGHMLGSYVDRFYTFDEHSAASAGLWVHKNFMPSDLLSWTTETGKMAIIAPDKGAAARAQDFADNIADYYGEKYRGLVPVIQCDKKRDFATGKFTGFTMPDLPAAKSYLIVDDICDGGGTFNLLAEEFDRRAPKKARLGLWVSHGIFSKGLNAISSRIQVIYTTDSWASRPGMAYRLEVVSLQPLIDKILEESDDA
jgi:ribose-phosphate pyrophosphokinase